MIRSYLTVVLLLWVASAPAENGPVGLAGLWGSERVFGPEVRGELTVERIEDRWRATIAGFDAIAGREADELQFALPGGRGELHAHLSPAGSLVGHWIQPRTVSSGVRYASPVELRVVAPDVWRGEVIPFDDRLSLYLRFSAVADGEITGFLRNPERNLGVYYRFQRVVLQGDVVRFLPADSGEEDVLRGTYNADRDLISIPFDQYGATFDFTRRARDEAAGFYPRTPAACYTYRAPMPVDDGWFTASLADADLDAGPLVALVERIVADEATSVRTPMIQALLIARGGDLVFEEYFHGFYRERVHDTRSAGKVLASTLVGIAIDSDADFTGDSLVYELLADQAGDADRDPRKNEVAVKHLLGMSAGYACDDNDGESPGNEDRMYEQTAQPDWYQYTLDLPMARSPGEQGVYCTAGVNLLGAILSQSTGLSTQEYFRRHLAGPLGISRYHLNLMPEGDGYLGGGLHLRPRDMLKLGQLFLDRGKWNGQQVVSSAWVDAATRPASTLYEPDDYGYNWWRKAYQVGGESFSAFYASGNGGQLVIVIPVLDLVVVFAAGNYGDFRTWRNFRDHLVPEYIIPAALPATGSH